MKLTKLKIIQEKAIVIAAYCDQVKSVNLNHLVHLWEEAGDEFEDLYPYSADNLQIASCIPDTDTTIQDLIKHFAYTPHLKIWVMGEELEKEDLERHLNQLRIEDICGKPLFAIGQHVSFKYQNEQGHFHISGTIGAMKTDLEFGSWLCKIHDVWYDQYLIEEQTND